MARPPASLLRTLISRATPRAHPAQATRAAAVRTFASTSIAHADPPKVPVALISKIRSARPGTPLTLARSALVAANNDLDAALAWIAQQAAESGAAKAEKLAGRTAEQGLVAVAVLADGSGGVGVRASLVEVRCETDFVARTDEFRELAEGIARSLAFFAEPSAGAAPHQLVKLDTKGAALLETPVVPPPSKVAELAASGDAAPHETVKASLASIVSRLGENIHLHRAASIALEPTMPSSSSAASPVYLASSYLHASKTPAAAAADGVQSGLLGGLLISRLPSSAAPKMDAPEVKGLLRALARQVVAIPTASIQATGASAAPTESGEPSTALYEQSLITMAPSAKFEFEAGSKVGDVLRKWSEVRGVEGAGLEVVELARWELGEAESEAAQA
ncbi:Elongation factor Ts, mitochondrial [Rhodotorula kratochvilovae]